MPKMKSLWEKLKEGMLLLSETMHLSILCFNLFRGIKGGMLWKMMLRVFHDAQNAQKVE